MTDKQKRTQENVLSEKLRQDIVLLKEYGFKKRSIQSVSLNVKKIDNFGMRQLDRLKMLLLRNEALIGKYPSKIRKGINRNDPRSFAEALVLLSRKLHDLMT
jgi:hypothetical protein